MSFLLKEISTWQLVFSCQVPSKSNSFQYSSRNPTTNMLLSGKHLFLATSTIVLVLFVYQQKWNNHSACFTENKNEELVDQDDPCLLEYIRAKYLKRLANGMTNHANQANNPSHGQSQRILDITGNITNGFYIECGAYDGETLSNTLYMERQLQWNGLLIEADPMNFEKIMTKNRNAWVIPACLSTTIHPQKVSFKQQGLVGKINTYDMTDFDKLLASRGAKFSGFTQVRCFPLYSILLAVGQTKVDYFSLDIEGDELDVLKTIPWHLVDIRTLTVEIWKEDVQN